MKKILLLIIFFIFFRAICADENLDSLKKALSVAAEEESIELNNKIASIYISKSPKKCLLYAERALTLSRKFNEKIEEAKALQILGEAYYFLGENDRALNNYKQAETVFREIDDQKGVASSLTGIGKIHRNLGKYKDARYYYEQAMKISEDLNDDEGKAASLNNLGILFIMWNDYEKAKKYLENSIKIKEKTGDKDGIANSLNNLGMIASRMKNYQEALKYYKRALDIKKEVDDKNGIASILQNISMEYYFLKEYDKAIDYQLQSVEFSSKEGLKERQLYAYKWLAEVYEDRKEIRNSLKYYKLYSNLKDSVYNRENAINLAEYEADLGMMRQKKENELLRKENEFQGQLRTYLIIIIALALLLAFLAYNRYRAKRKLNDILTRKNQQITEQNEKLEIAYNELEIKSNELKHQNKFLQMLIDSIPNPVFFKDTDMRYTGCNAEFEKFAGRSRDELIGHTVFDFTGENIAKLTTDRDRDVLHTDEIMQYETTVLDGDNNEMDVIYYKTRFFDYDGNVAGLIGVMLDISERKQTEEKLRESEIELRKLNEQKDEYLNIIKRELKNAEEYLVSLIPDEIHEGSIQTRWQLKPSISLGGDAFGYHWIDDDNIALYLLDVSGHGIGVSLHAVSILNTIKNERLKNTDFRSPATVLKSLNSAFQMSDHNEMFFTIWYAVYCRSSKILKYANAGHHPALLLDENNGIHKLFAYNTPIGAMRDFHYAGREFKISGKSQLYIFSDGAFEIETESGEILGFDRLCDFIIQYQKNGTDDIDLIYEYAKSTGDRKTLEDDYSMLKVIFA